MPCGQEQIPSAIQAIKWFYLKNSKACINHILFRMNVTTGTAWANPCIWGFFNPLSTQAKIWCSHYLVKSTLLVLPERISKTHHLQEWSAWQELPKPASLFWHYCCHFSEEMSIPCIWNMNLSNTKFSLWCCLQTCEMPKSTTWLVLTLCICLFSLFVLQKRSPGTMWLSLFHFKIVFNLPINSQKGNGPVRDGGNYSLKNTKTYSVDVQIFRLINFLKSCFPEQIIKSFFQRENQTNTGNQKLSDFWVKIKTKNSFS